MARLLLLLIACAAVLGLIHREEERGTFESLQREHLGWLKVNSPHGSEEQAPIAFLAIVDADLPPAERVFQAWPLSEIDYALIFDNLVKQEPRSVAISPILHWADSNDLFRGSLVERAEKLPRPVFSTILQNEPSATEPLEKGFGANLFKLPSVEGDLSKIPEFHAVDSGTKEDLQALGPSGFSYIDLGAGVQLGEDAIKVPVLARHSDGTVVASLALATMAQTLEVPPDKIRVRLGETIEIGETQRFPIDHAGYFSIQTGVRDPIIRVDASQLLLDPALAGSSKLDGEETGNVEKIKGSIVIVGLDHKESARFELGDGYSISRGELLALTVSRMSSQHHVKTLPKNAQYGFWLGIFLLGLLLSRLRKWTALKIALLCLLTMAIASLLIFQSSQIWIPMLRPAALLATVLIFRFLSPNSGENPEEET